jgi:hypothetical protein
MVDHQRETIDALFSQLEEKRTDSVINELYTKVVDLYLKQCNISSIDDLNDKLCLYMQGNMLWFNLMKRGSLDIVKWMYYMHNDICGIWRKKISTSPINFSVYTKPKDIENYVGISAEIARFHKQSEIADWLEDKDI